MWPGRRTIDAPPRGPDGARRHHSFGTGIDFCNSVTLYLWLYITGVLRHCIASTPRRNVSQAGAHTWQVPGDATAGVCTHRFVTRGH